MLKSLFLLLLFASFTLSSLAQKKAVSLNHIAVYVNSLNKSEAFYSNVIGLDTIANPFRDGRHTWYSIGAHSQLHLISGAKTAIKTDKNSHLCFSVPSIDVIIAALKKGGIPYEDWAGKKNAVTTRPDGVKQIYLQDPDGYWIEINNDTY